MAEQQWINLLLQGVETWNEAMLDLRANPDRYPGFPDLSRARICEKLMAVGRVTEAGLPDLRNYDLSFADLSGSNLAGVDLTGAQCRWTKFDGASLRGADLTEANCNNAKFTDANLDGTTLLGTGLSDSIMVGASLLGSRYWQANCFGFFDWSRRLLSLGSKASLDQVVDDVSALLRQMDILRQHYASNRHGETIRFYYRGEESHSPSLTPGAMRNSGFRAFEANMLIDMISRRPEDFAHDNTAIGQMVIAQHYGLPTRLLDVTRNPLVAMFHAAVGAGDGRVHVFALPLSMVKPFNSATVSVLANFARLPRGEQNLLLGKSDEETNDDVTPGSDRPGIFMGYGEALSHLYQLIQLEKPSFAHRIEPQDFLRVFVVEPQQSFERLRAQSGAFLLSAFHEGFDEESIRKWNQDGAGYHHYILSVPIEAKQGIREQLSEVDITQESLSPSLEATADAITRVYRSPASTDKPDSLSPNS